MMVERKGQAALEFLTTYGWAILTIMIVIGALSSFGVLDPDTLIPERCQFSKDFRCDDYKVVGEPDYEVNLYLSQNFGETIYVEDIICEYPRSGNGTWSGSPGTEWKAQQSITVNCTPSGGGDNFLVTGKKERVDVTIEYKLDQTGYVHYAQGEVYASVMEP